MNDGGGHGLCKSWSSREVLSVFFARYRTTTVLVNIMYDKFRHHRIADIVQSVVYSTVCTSHGFSFHDGSLLQRF